MSAATTDAGSPATSVDRADVLRRLARPVTDADRRRARLVSFAVAGCGMFALATIAILAIHGDTDGETITTDANGNELVIGAPSVRLIKLAPYLGQRGLRGGTAFGAALLVIPFVLFGIQALRTGTAARERRLAALSLAGATRPQLRRLAFLEGTRAAAIGALLAGPGYLLLWLVAGFLLPDGWKMLPVPGIAVLIGWPSLVIVLAVLGGVVARRAATPATVSPLGMSRRQPRALRTANATTPVAALLLTCAGLLLVTHGSSWAAVVAFPAVSVFAITLGPWLILLTGRWAISRGLSTTMAGRRLLADVRSPGRVAGVLLAVGIAFGVIASQVADILVETGENHYDLSFFLGGYTAATAGALLVCVVACSSLVVAATEQVLDGRRANAVLVALAASPRFIIDVVRRQLLLAAVPAAVLGGLLGWLVSGGLLLAWGDDDHAALQLALVVALPCALIVSALAAGLGARIAAGAVRPAILAGSSADNLRAP